MSDNQRCSVHSSTSRQKWTEPKVVKKLIPKEPTEEEKTKLAKLSECPANKKSKAESLGDSVLW